MVFFNLTGINMSPLIQMIPRVIYHQSLIILIELLVVFLITIRFMQTLRYHPGFASFSKVIRDKVFKNGPRQICGIQPFTKLYKIFFKRLYSSNFTWPFLEYFVQFMFFKFVHTVKVINFWLLQH